MHEHWPGHQAQTLCAKGPAERFMQKEAQTVCFGLQKDKTCRWQFVRVQFSNILLRAPEGMAGKSEQDVTLLPGVY